MCIRDRHYLVCFRRWINYSSDVCEYKTYLFPFNTVLCLFLMFIVVSLLKADPNEHINDWQGSQSDCTMRYSSPFQGRQHINYRWRHFLNGRPHGYLMKSRHTIYFPKQQRLVTAFFQCIHLLNQSELEKANKQTKTKTKKTQWQNKSHWWTAEWKMQTRNK